MPALETLNYLLPSKATLDIRGASAFSFQVQKFNVPSMYGYIVEQPTPRADAPLPGNKLVYSLLEVEFLITENIESWKNIHDWMRGVYAPERTEEYRNKKMYLEDAHLTVYTNANNPNLRIKFIDMFPVKLSDINFNVGNQDAEPVTTRAEFAFLRYDIEKL